MPRNGTAPTLEGVDVSELRIVTLEDILGADDLPEETVAVPEWGGAVRIKGFSKQQQFDIREEASPTGEFDTKLFEVLIFVHGVIEPVIGVEQLELLKTKNATVVDRVIERIMAISGMSEEARKRAKTTFPPKV